MQSKVTLRKVKVGLKKIEGLSKKSDAKDLLSEDQSKEVG